MIPSGDTWGISGPVFLLVYVLLAVAVAVAVRRTRRSLAEVPVTRPVDRLAERPYDVAHLNGGEDLALCAALSAMRRSGTIASAGRGSVVAAQRPDPRADELERAVHHAAAVAVPRRQLGSAGAVASALHRIESRLVDAGLLLTAERRHRIRATSWWTFALAALGAVRIVAGIAGGRAVGLLVVLVLATLVVGVVQGRSVPRRSRAGDEALRRLADEHHALSPATGPDWAVYGPAGAALAVGVFGVGALWAADPAFAGELALQRAAASGSGSGAYAGGDSGSGGDSGGSSGSSCGGGGGGGCGG
jgi:uncharacterized protein (TIGR04222 family)